MYDLPAKKCTEYVEMEVTEQAETHGITGMLITAKEYKPIECNRRDRDSGKSCVNSIKTNLLGENYGRNNFYQGGFST